MGPCSCFQSAAWGGCVYLSVSQLMSRLKHVEATVAAVSECHGVCVFGKTGKNASWPILLAWVGLEGAEGFAHLGPTGALQVCAALSKGMLGPGRAACGLASSAWSTWLMHSPTRGDPSVHLTACREGLLPGAAAL